MNAQTAAIRASSSTQVRPSRLLDVLATHSGPASTVLRLTLAAVLFPHGAQKLLGWWGGYGFEGTQGFLTQQIGLPAPLAAGVILFEFFGPILLVLGVLTRPLALATIGIMIGAVATVHWPFGFFMNWTGAQAGEGFEFHLLVVAIAAALLIQGGGALSLDRRVAEKLARARAA